MSAYTVEQFNLAARIMRRAEEDITHVTGMAVTLLMNDTSLPNITTELIIRFAADAGGVQFEGVVGESRIRELINPRFVSMTLAHKYQPHLSLREIGNAYGKDHSSVINAMAKSANYYDTDDAYRSLYDRTEMAIKQWQEETYK